MAKYLKKVYHTHNKLKIIQVIKEKIENVDTKYMQTIYKQYLHDAFTVVATVQTGNSKEKMSIIYSGVLRLARDRE